MNDNYYQPADSTEWDRFVDYCDDNDLNPLEEDFETWVEEQREAAEEAHAERMADLAREREW